MSKSNLPGSIIILSGILLAMAPVSAYISGLILLLILLLRGTIYEKGRLTMLQFFLFGSALLSSTFAIHKGISFISSLVFILYFLSYLTGISVSRQKMWYIKILDILSIAIIIYSVIGIIQYIIPFHFTIDKIHIINPPYKGRRITSLVHNPIILASFYAFFLLFFIEFFKERKILFSLTIALGGVAFILTQSRGPFIGIIISILIYAFLKKRKGFALISLIIIFLTVLLIHPFRDRIFSTFSQFSDKSRIASYRAGINLFIHHNLLTGIGVNNFAILYREYSPNIKFHNIPYIHSIFLNFLVETGLIGLTIIVWLFVEIFRSLALIVKLGGKEEKRIAMVLLSAFAGMLVHNLVDNTIYVAGLGLIYWFFIGVIKGIMDDKGT